VRGSATDANAEEVFTTDGGVTDVDPMWEQRTVVTANGPAQALVGHRRDVVPGRPLDGPAVLHQDDSTTWVPPGWRCAAEAGGLMTLRRTTGEEMT
jgi:N-methylhydantoinase A/oxoprolinase/acetone carboxylase beta subunit